LHGSVLYICMVKWDILVLWGAEFICGANIIEISEDLQKLLWKIYCHVFMDHTV